MSRNSAPTPASDSAAGAPTKVRAVTNPLTIRPLRVVVVALMIGALPLGNVRAESGSMGVITSSPKADDVVDGSKVPIILRFDAPAATMSLSAGHVARRPAWPMGFK